MLRYLAYRKLCDATFVWFLLSWFVTRHVLYNIVLWSVYAHLPHRPTFLWDPSSEIYLSKGMWLGFFLMLVALQVRDPALARYLVSALSVNRFCK
jgi:acyl-CoA-dependent ceramide synthase